MPGDHGAHGGFDDRAVGLEPAALGDDAPRLFALAGVGALLGAAAAKFLLKARERASPTRSSNASARAE